MGSKAQIQKCERDKSLEAAQRTLEFDMVVVGTRSGLTR